MIAPPPPSTAPPHLPDIPPGVLGTRSYTGITYAAVPGFRPLLLDLHLPPRTGPPPPVAVFVHGGGWRQGSRSEVGPRFAQWSPTPFQTLAAAGLAVVSVDYRLSGEATWPAQIEDVVTAVRWIRTHGADLGINADRMALWGESAGGHLAALAGLLGEDPARGAGAVEAVVDWYGPADLLTLATQLGPDSTLDPDAADSRESMLLGAAVPTVPEKATDASPVHHVSSLAPPFLLIHGRADTLVPAAQSELLAEALRGCGVPVTTEFIEGADHLWFGNDDAPSAAFELTLAFLVQHLRP